MVMTGGHHRHQRLDMERVAHVLTALLMALSASNQRNVGLSCVLPIPVIIIRSYNIITILGRKLEML